MAYFNTIDHQNTSCLYAVKEPFKSYLDPTSDNAANTIGEESDRGENHSQPQTDIIITGSNVYSLSDDLSNIFST